MASHWERERGELPHPYEPLEAKPPRVLFFWMEVDGIVVDPSDESWFTYTSKIRR